jgi:hypothetical protein
MRATALLLAAALGAATPARAAVEFVPVFDASFLLGQLYENGSASSWQGNGSLQATPALKFNDEWGLIPTYAFNYQGTKSVTDLGSGGQLFQDSMSHALIVKGVWKHGDLKLKPHGGYRWEFLRETTDESWGKGLFDYQKPSLGLDAEYALAEGWTGTAGFDWYLIRFPNYSSLESGVVSQGLGRAEAAPRTLDSENLSWTAQTTFPTPAPDVKGLLTLNWTTRSYGEQHIVVASGDLTPDTRVDQIKSITGTLFWGRKINEDFGLFVNLQGAWTRVDSNQNNYDAAVNVFLPDYYGYEETSIQPRATAVVGPKKVEVSFAYLRSHRRYLARPAQDAAGAYLSDAQSIDQDNFTFDLGVPIDKHWKVLATANMATASSNQQYQLFFKTNYTLQSYLLGVSYSY